MGGVGFTFRAEDKGLMNSLMGVQSALDVIAKSAEALQTATAAATAPILDLTKALNPAVMGSSSEALSKIADTMTETADAAAGTVEPMADLTESVDELTGPKTRKGFKGLRDGAGKFAKSVKESTKTADTSFLSMKGFGFVSSGIKGLGSAMSGILPTLTAGAQSLAHLAGEGASQLSHLGGEALNLGKRLTSALGEKAMAGISHAVGKISEAGQNAMSSFSAFTENSTNLTTAWEAEQQHHAEAARRIGVNYGFLGKDLRSFAHQSARMADALAISDEAAAQAVKGFRSYGSEFKAVGLGSASLVAKFSAVTGVSADTMSTVLAQARSEFGFADEDLRTLTNSTVSFGRASNDVGGALNNLPALLNQVRQMAAQTGAAMDPKSLAKYTAGVNAAALAFYDVSQNGEDAKNGAMELSTALLNAQRTQGDLFAGNADDIAQLATSLAIGTGDVKKSFDLMNSGPEGFMSGLAQMVQSARKAGHGGVEAMNFLRSNLDQALGPEATNRLMTFVEKAKGATLDQLANGKVVTQDLGRMAKEGFATGRTTADNFERMQSSFIASFRSIGRSAVGDFMGSTGKAFGEFNSMLRGVVKGGGPLADIVVKLSEVHQLGAVAFLPPNLRGFATVMGTAVSAMGPTIDTLHKLGFSLSSLTSPITLLGAPLAALGLRFGQVFMKTHDANQALAVVFSDIDKYAGMAGDFVAKAVPLIAKAIPMILKVVGTLFVKMEPVIGQAIGGILSTLGDLAMELLKYLKTVDWKGVLTTLFDGLSAALGKAIPLAMELVSTLFTILGKAFDGASLGGMLGGLAGVAQTLLNALMEGFKQIDFGAIGNFLGGLLGTISDALGKINFASVGKTLAGLASALAEGLMTALEAIPWDKVLGGALHIADALVDLIVAAVPEVVKGLQFLLSGAIKALGGLASFLGKSGFLDGLMTSLHKVLGGLISIVVDSLLPAATDLLVQLANKLPGIVSDLLDGVIKVVMRLPGIIGPLVKSLGEKLGNYARAFLPKLLDAAWNLISSIPGLVWKVVQAIPGLLAQIGPMLGQVADGIKTFVLGIFDGIRDWLVNKFPGAAGFITGVFDTVRNVVGGTIDFIKTVAMGMWSVLVGVADVVVKVFNVVKDAVVAAYQWIAEKASVAYDWIVENVIGPLKDAWGSVSDFLKETFGPAVDWLTEKLNAFIGWASGALDTINETLHGIAETIGIAEAKVNPKAVAAVAEVAAKSAQDQLAALNAMPKAMADMLVKLGKVGPEAAAAFQAGAKQIHATTAATAAATTTVAHGALAAVSTAAQGAHAATADAATKAVTAGKDAHAALAAALAPPAAAPAADSLASMLHTSFGELPKVASDATTKAATAAQTSFAAIEPTATASATAVKTAFMDMTTSVAAQFATLRAGTTGQAGYFTTVAAEGQTAVVALGAKASAVTGAVTSTFAAQVQAMTGGVEAMLIKTLGEGVMQGFAGGLLAVQQFTEKVWMPKQLLIFQNLTTAIRDQYGHLLVDLIKATEAAFAYLEDESRRLSAVESRFAHAVGLRAAAEATMQAPGPADIRSKLGGKSTADNNDLLSAIEQPDWYTDYRKLFTAKMDALTAEVRASGARVPVGARTSPGTSRNAIGQVNQLLGTSLGSGRSPTTPEGVPPTAPRG